MHARTTGPAVPKEFLAFLLCVAHDPAPGNKPYSLRLLATASGAFSESQILSLMPSTTVPKHMTKAGKDFLMSSDLLTLVGKSGSLTGWLPPFILSEGQRCPLGACLWTRSSKFLGFSAGRTYGMHSVFPALYLSDCTSDPRLLLRTLVSG